MIGLPKASLLGVDWNERLVLVGILAATIAASARGGGPIEGTNWFPIGPAPIVGFFPGGTTGRASAIAVNPHNLEEVWVGTAAGGVWHSTNGGTNWTPLTDKQVSLAIGALAVDNCGPGGCTTIYAGTGENAIRRDTYYGAGLLIFDVFGEFPMWVVRGESRFKWGSIFNVVLDETTFGPNQRIFVTVSSGTTVSSTEATVTAPEPSGGYGIHRSDDQGETWELLTVSGAEGDRPTDLEIDPSDSQTLYAGFLGRGVFKTTNGGDSWCPLGEGIPLPPGCPNTTGLPDVTTVEFDHVEIALFPGDASILYASFGMCPDQLLQDCEPSIYKSIDGGVTWELKHTGSTSGDIDSCPDVYSRYTHGLTVHPSNHNTLWLAGGHICKSINGGATFTQSDAVNDAALEPSQWPPIVHLDHHAIVFHPLDANRMYDTSDGGFARSTDGGASWIPVNDDLQITGFQSIASSPLTGRVIGASQDNSGQLWSGARAWQLLPCCGDGGFSVMDYDDVMTMYVGNNYGQPKRSTNGGATWSSITSGITGADPQAFYAPIVQRPTSPHTLYYGTNQLYRSINDGDSWTVISPALSTTSQPEIEGGQNVITAIGPAPSDVNRVYIGYYGGEIYVTDTGCTTTDCWDLVSDGLPSAPVTRIAVHPTDEDVAYATFSGFASTAHVWKTTDRGGSWDPVADGLPSGMPVNTISIEPSFPERLWLGADAGVYKSTNAGADWTLFSDGLPLAPVFEISIDETHGRVYAATHGRGAFVLSKPFLSNFEGWVNGSIWDIPVYGHGFLPNEADCTMQVLRQNGTVCAEDDNDARGADIRTDGDGRLTSDMPFMYSGQDTVLACFNGTCLGGVDISACNQPGNPITTVLVNCGGQLGIDAVLGCPQISNPPPSLMGLSGLDGSVASAGPDPMGSFDVVATVQAGDGTTRSLCTAHVELDAGDNNERILERARDALNTSLTCAENTVTARLDNEEEDGGSEDEFEKEPRLYLQAPGVQGTQVLTALHASPGQATGVCFHLEGLGVPVLNALMIMRLRFETAAGGAAGGSLRIIENSPLGSCGVIVPTFAGDAPADIASAVYAAFNAPGIPGPHPGCPARHNPRDVTLHGDSVVAILPTGYVVCVNDDQVGFSLAPEELLNAHPVADSGEDQTVTATCAAPSSASVLLGGSGSTDPDSTPGTNDDIIQFEWFEEFGVPSQRLLGAGESILVDLPPGDHRITLRVTDRDQLFALDEVLIHVDVCQLKLDIEPGCCPNPIYQHGAGIIRVVVVGEVHLDVETVDLASLQLVRTDGHGGVVRPLRRPAPMVVDVASPFERHDCDCHRREADGLLDLSLKFAEAIIVRDLELGDLHDKTQVSLVLRGQLSDGTPFEAGDCVELRDARRPRCACNK